MERRKYYLAYTGADGVERVFHLIDTLLVGRAPSCHIVLDFEGVSREHCRISLAPGGATLVDCGSTNGTFLNGAKVREAAVRPGDRIVAGRACLVLHEAGTGGGREGARAAPREGERTARMGDTTIEVLLKEASGRLPDSALLDRAALRGDAFRALFRITDLMNSEKESDALLGEFLSIVMDLYGMDLGALFLAGGAGVPPRCLLERNVSGVEGYQPSRSVLGRVIDEGVSVAAVDPSRDPRFAKAGSVAGAGTARILCVPMRSSGRVSGAVYLSSLKESRGRGRPTASKESLQLLSALAAQVARAVENLRYRGRLERDNRILRREAFPEGELVGSSKAMERVRELIGKVAPTNATVLVTGESGTGKELIARALHRGSARGDRPMICVNCGAIPESMVESELFGHEKGAFTGAVERRPGRFELAHEGTLFLDEVGELPLPVQVKLLRVLEEKCFYRVGGKELVRVDVRIVAATNTDLEERCRKGEFREDLLFRLEVFRIHAPPLREHREDIPDLARYFLSRLAAGTGLASRNRGSGRGEGPGIMPEGMKRLVAYSWPGNARELKNAVERELILSGGAPLAFEGLGAAVSRGGAGARPSIPALGGELPLKEIERAHIAGVLAAAGWNKKLAAGILGISRPTLYDKIKQYGIREDEPSR